MNDDQRWRDAHPWGPDDEPIGVVYNEKRHRWAHAWSEYLVIMVGLLGAIALIGAVKPFSAVRLGGALMILAGSFAFSRSDRAHQSSPRNERIWALAAVLLTVGGLTVFVFSW